MSPVDLSQVPEYLRSRRWFGGKAWPIKQVNVLDHVPLDLPATSSHPAATAVLAIVEVTYELGNPEHYLLPVIPTAKGFTDAVEHDGFARALFSLVKSAGSLPAGTGTLKAEVQPGGERLIEEVSENDPVRRIGTEQSNSSLVFGEKVIFKLIRKLESGVHPEYEIGRFLTVRRPFARTPRLLAALQLESPTGMTLGVVHQYVPSQGDGWSHVVKCLREARGPQDALLREIQTLGQRTGEMHKALASDDSDPAFLPEPIQREDLQRWSSSIVGEIGVALSLAAESAPELSDRRGILTAHAQKLARVEPSGQKTRVHGDYHLGQVLFTDGDWILFDFEGEPSRPLAQRREKYSPLKDVAQMLRSFAYAAVTADAEGKLTREWLPKARAAYLKGYWGATRGCAFLPEDDTAEVLLEAMELEKLVTELRYEVQHRPTWAWIPVQAMLAVEDRP